MSHHHHTTLSTEGQDRRRLAMQRALAQVRLEGLEPDPVVFAYVERYIRGEITIEDAVAAMIQRFAVSERGDGEADGGEPHS